MGNQLNISSSPHIHSGESVRKNMHGVLIALVPALIVSLLYFGWGALVVTTTSVLACVFFEWAIGKFIMKKTVTTIGDGSAIITGILLAFNLPSNLPVWMVITGALFAIGICKMSFGGLGNNPFNPALAGRVFLLLSFPAQMTTFPEVGQLISYMDAETAATPLAIMKKVIHGVPGTSLSQLPDAFSLFIGSKGGGSLGEVSAVALLIGLLFMLWRKIITWHIPVSILIAVFIFTGGMHIANPEIYASPVIHLLSGGLILGAVFMATDYVTSPMSKSGMLIYGACIGLLTVIIRLFGTYPEGMSFAILIMNAFTPLINRYCKPKTFGERGKNMKKLKSSLKNMLLVLVGITVISIGLLTYANKLTKVSIDEAKMKALNDALKEVVPSFTNNPANECDTLFGEKNGKKTVDFIIYPAKNKNQLVGTAVEATSSGFGGEFKLLVGFDTEGNIYNYTLLSHSETLGLGSRASYWFKEGHKGSIKGMNPGKKPLKVNKDGGDVDAITASTVTSRAFLNAVNKAYSAYYEGNADGTTSATQQAY